MSDEPKMSEESHTLATTFAAMAQVGIERKSRIMRLRERVTRLHSELARAEEELRVEEAEHASEGAFLRDVFEQWKSDIQHARGAEPAEQASTASVPPPGERAE